MIGVYERAATLWNVNVAPRVSAGARAPRARALGELAALGRELRERLGVGVVDRRDDERVLRGDGDADVHARVELEAPVAVGGVRARRLAQRERGRAQDERPRRRRRARAAAVDVGVERRLHLGHDRLRLGDPARDDLLRPRRLDDGDVAAARGGGLLGQGGAQ